MVEPRDGIWRPQPGATATALEALSTAAPVPLPASYLAQLASSDGGEGDLAAPPAWVSLWPAATVIDLNASYDVHRFLPGFFGFGSNGGGELLAFDVRSPPPYPVVAVPFVPMDLAELTPLAANFDDFRELIGMRYNPH